MNVLAMVNKGLTLFQWKNDLPGAEAIIQEALASDPECEAAVATLAQISLQKGNWSTAAEMYKKQADIARVPQDLLNAKIYQYVRVCCLTSALLLLIYVVNSGKY